MLGLRGQSAMWEAPGVAHRGGTGMGRHGSVVCAARVVMGPPPSLWQVHHTQTAVFSHATAVTSLRPTRTQGTVKRWYRVQTEASLASNLCVTLPRATVLPPGSGPCREVSGSRGPPCGSGTRR